MLVGPGGTAFPAQRYADFLAQTPQWPQRVRILWRYQNALSQTTDPQILNALCPRYPLTLPAAFEACAPHLPDAASTARRLWLSGNALTVSEEQMLLQRFGQSFTPADQWARYEALELRGQFSVASRQIERLAPEQQALARARLAERLASPDADSLFASLSADLQSDPALIRYRLRALRRGDRLDEALSLWNAQGAALQQASPSHDWSSERISLARALLLAGRPKEAADLADDTTMAPDTTDRQEAELLSGIIALRELQAPARAEKFFRPLQNATSLQMQARGYYWTGRALQIADRQQDAEAAFRKAASYPTTFPGQLALAALTQDESILVSGKSSEAFDSALLQALQTLPIPTAGTLSRTDLLEAATDLVQAGDPDHAREFLMMLGVVNPSPEGQKAVADAASRLGLAAPEVFASYALARKGVALYPQGFPDPYPSASTVPDGLLPAIIRQESGFDPDAISGAHAVGLLQLLPAAAKDVVRKADLGSVNVSPAALTDPQTNLRIGNAYVSQLLERFGNVIPYALAAYNAGPHRVDLWLKADPPSEPLSEDGVLDWIERLPYRETRLYIENIEASMMIYRVRNLHAG
ncbi:transglycosylase SLT domain-containing protein [Gluconobacter sp. R71646]|uniref:Transglycosylase SLT domain-containing protein n=1 Tax=Gluconobacter potus TaxID=2724927 RepID=A0ABR9YNL0_9PROT|nr:transglycosylase SLT domain-containing protein [Gluconobacter sp. R71656]MBF0868421.1 transglycosylase SLT domain-containing protein [Gluconobacter sp. R75628]MBF0874403.1 transglycosylase SLT domain-containing protein [Gluconobacter sp. R75629]MBF0883394.1 transglycosylase SLT domain-containing protein [Gluconobacter potus]